MILFLLFSCLIVCAQGILKVFNMSMSGLKISEEAIRVIEDIRKGSSTNGCVCLKVNSGKTEIVVHKILLKEGLKFGDLVDLVDDKEPLWFFFDAAIVVSDSDTVQQKLIFVAMTPPKAIVKRKMIFAASTGTVRDKVKPNARLECDERAEFTPEAILDKLTMDGKDKATSILGQKIKRC